MRRRSWWIPDVSGLFILSMLIGYTVMDLAGHPGHKPYLCCAGLGFLAGRIVGAREERGRKENDHGTR